MDKADISLTTIVIAAIALIVLIVLVAIFTGKIHLFSDDLASCTSKGGRCTGEPCAGAIIQNTECQASGLTCCIPLGLKS